MQQIFFVHDRAGESTYRVDSIKVVVIIEDRFKEKDFSRYGL